MDRIVLRGLHLPLHLGVGEEEAARTQPVVLDIELHLPLAEAGAHDALAATVDYAAVVAAVHAALEQRRFRLLEAVADRAARAVRASARPTPHRVVVRVRKSRPPVSAHLETAEVEVWR